MAEWKRPKRKATQESWKGNTSLPFESDSSMFHLICNNPGIIFSGAGMSVSAGLDVFSTAVTTDADSKSNKRSSQKKSRRIEPPSHGDTSLYSQAAKALNLKGDGKHAFHYRFLQEHPVECFQFLAWLYTRTSEASPTLAHQIVGAMGDRLIRHYTLNIDGLAVLASMEGNEKKVVEVHGSLRQLVCRSCGLVCETKTILGPLLQKNAGIKHTFLQTDIPVPTCSVCQGLLRFRIVMYDDAESHLIHSINPFETILPGDLQSAKWIVWVGTSFRQQASCEHFTNVLGATCPIILVDPHVEEVLENLESVVGSLEGLVHPISMTSDEFFRTVEAYRHKH